MSTETSTQLLRAVKRGDVAAVRALIAGGADLGCEDSQGWTPLFKAAGTGNIQMMGLLIDAGAPVNLHEDTGFTPLFCALLSRHHAAVRLLLDSGASPHIAPDGIPLVHHVPSDWSNRDEIIQLLSRPDAANKA